MSMSPEMQMEVGKQLQISQQFDLSQVPTTHLEASFFGYIAKAQAEGRFDVVFEDLMQKLETVPQIKGRLSALPPEKKA